MGWQKTGHGARHGATCDLAAQRLQGPMGVGQEWRQQTQAGRPQGDHHLFRWVWVACLVHSHPSAGGCSRLQADHPRVAAPMDVGMVQQGGDQTRRFHPARMGVPNAFGLQAKAGFWWGQSGAEVLCIAGRGEPILCRAHELKRVAVRGQHPRLGPAATACLAAQAALEQSAGRPILTRL